MLWVYVSVVTRERDESERDLGVARQIRFRLVTLAVVEETV